MGYMTQIIGRLGAQQQILGSESGQRQREGQLQASQAMMQVKNDLREQANELNSFASTVNIVASAVQKGSMVAGKFQEAGTQIDAAKTQDQMQSNMQDSGASGANGANGANGGDADASKAALAATRIGESGPLFGERFPPGTNGNPGQLETLADAQQVRDVVRQNTGPDGVVDRDAVTREFMDRGFSEGEARDLTNRATSERGWSREEASKFAWDHRKTESQAKTEARQEQIKNALIGELTPALMNMFASNVNSTAAVYQDRAKKFGNDASELASMSTEANERWVAHNKEIGAIELETIRRQHSGKPSGK